MECFTHLNSAAVGVCKSCGKGVCRACAISVDRGLACSEACRPISEGLSLVQATSIRNVGIQSVQRFVLALIPALFLAIGLYSLLIGHSDIYTWFYLAAGVGFGMALLIARKKRDR